MPYEAELFNIGEVSAAGKAAKKRLRLGGMAPE